MGKLELEVKILDIDKEKFIKKLEKLGAKLKKETKQYLYTYDLPTIYGRYVDIMMQLNNPESKIKYETAVSKLKLLFFDLDNLIESNIIKKSTGFNTLTEILKQKNMLEILNSKKFINLMKKYQNNQKKWIRIRQTNDKTTITVKFDI